MAQPQRALIFLSKQQPSMLNIKSEGWKDPGVTQSEQAKIEHGRKLNQARKREGVTILRRR